MTANRPPAIFACLLLAACATTGPEPAGIRIVDDATLAPIADKQLQLDSNVLVIHPDGTLDGEFGGVALAGTWTFEDGYWCRTLTAGPEGVLRRPEDCQLLELSGHTLKATRDRGEGDSFEYHVEP